MLSLFLSGRGSDAPPGKTFTVPSTRVATASPSVRTPSGRRLAINSTRIRPRMIPRIYFIRSLARVRAAAPRPCHLLYHGSAEMYTGTNDHNQGDVVAN